MTHQKAVYKCINSVQTRTKRHERKPLMWTEDTKWWSTFCPCESCTTDRKERDGTLWKMKEKVMERAREECGEDKERERTSAHRFRQSTEEALGVWLPVCSHGICCFDSLCHHHLHLSAPRSAPWLSAPTFLSSALCTQQLWAFHFAEIEVEIKLGREIWRLMWNVRLGRGRCRLQNKLINAN